ncbi:spermatogenesis-and oogenesis-specific basic helix-loop-helix-containing protein 2 [Elysia marginata]|uniref:Spermatogenesis-and oogenesis-specific basic helix-loop-helix-containing protein 2 n=1 Tax=Elysia marginata TaxID=1093978 RepID=A0AAV4HN77_9GAST|nr:spermatogenesis-and oogenesis-specific basic helix-loop-helix-containing protein 2 [Elysia marginata]
MEPRELNPSDKTWAEPELHGQSCEKSDIGDTCHDQVKPSDKNSLSSPHHSSVKDEKDTTDDNGGSVSDNKKPKTEQDKQGLIVDLDKYRGLTALQELAKTARAENSVCGNDKGNIFLLTKNSNTNFLNIQSETLLDNMKITNNGNVDKTAETEVSSGTLSPTDKQLFSGPLTHGARKFLTAAITKSLVHHIPFATSVISENSLSSTTPSLTVVASSNPGSSSPSLRVAACSNARSSSSSPSLRVVESSNPGLSSSSLKIVASSNPGSSTPSLRVVASSNPGSSYNISSNSENIHSRSLPLLSPLLSPISAAAQSSPTPSSLPSPQLPVSLFDMSNSFFTTDSSSHADAGDESEGQRSRSHSLPSRWTIDCEKATIDDDDLDDDDENDMVDFITNAMGNGTCATVEHEKGKSNSEWMIDCDAPSVEMPELTPQSTPVAAVTRPISHDGLLCLLISGEEDEPLKQSIQDALQTACVQTASPAEAVAKCNKEAFDLIWVRITVPVKEELLSVVASVRYSSGKSKGARIIAVADKTLLVDLLLRLFDDVFLEPLPMMTIRHKYSSLSKSKRSSSMQEADGTQRDLNTPESSLSLESTKSQSTPSDSGMDFSDLTLQPLKPGPQISHQNTSTDEFIKSPLDLESPPSPVWCKVEHANKEKQRRVRIKDSCDQLRKLLPYVRGRKTDMASILEMTVDYLQIVNASLPAEFQTKVIEMLSPDLSLLEGRIHSSEPVTTTAHKTHIGGQICPSTCILTKPNLNKSNINNSNKNISGNINTTIGSNINLNRMTTRSQVSKVSSENSSSGVKENVQTKTEPNMFTDPVHNEDSNANTIEGPDRTRKFDATAVMSKPFHKRELPLNANLVCSTPKRPHVVFTSKPKDNQAPGVYLAPGATEPSKAKSDCTLENAHRLSGIQFPHMFTEGDISANRMFSTGRVSNRSDAFPYQTPSYLNTAGPTARVPGVPCDGGEMVASVNNMFFDTAYYYYPSSHDSSNGNYFVNGGSSSEYVNPNAVLPVTCNSSSSRITNFNLGRRYERLSVSGESERYSETTIGSVSLHHHHHQHQQHPL